MRRIALKSRNSGPGLWSIFSQIGRRVRARLRSRHGRSSALLVAGLGAVAFGTGGFSSRRPVPRASTGALAVAGDTVVIWGPRQFNGSNGQGQTYVEGFTATVTPGRLHTLHLVNGNASGGQRASKVIIKLNGFEVVAQNEVTQAVALLDRPIALTAADTIRVTVAGSGSPFITLSVLSTPEPGFDVYGPNQYAITSGTTKTYNENFTRAASAGPPFRIYVVNGAGDGSQRVTSASITLNGSAVVTTSQLTSAVGSLSKTVTLNASNTLQVVVNGSVNRYITVRFTASDTAKPVLTITSPTPNSATNSASISVTGTIQDQTATSVTINGVAASVTNNTTYSGSASLPTQGAHLITVRAIDAAGNQRDSTRVVIRDSQAPALTVTAPANGTMTVSDSILVSGSVSDISTVTVNVNGSPLTVSGGTFSGKVALADGPNVLAITATDAAGNSTSESRTVTRDGSAPVLVVTAPADNTTTGADSVTVSGTATDASALRVVVSGTALTVDGTGAFSGKVALAPGPNALAILAIDAIGLTTTLARTVTRTGGIPPDPSTVAPAFDAGAASVMISAASFLYSGANPIQTGVAPGTIEPRLVGVLRGTVTTREGQPLAGARVTVLHHPEFGQTFSRADGGYDMAVNAGTRLTVAFAKPGFLSAQRSGEAVIQQYTRMDDVALVELDPVVTTVNLSGPLQTVRGSVSTDNSGSRQATLVFKPGTQATMTLADNSAQALTSLSVRATEYTVGPGGPRAMAAVLPPQSGYTYAVELSIDEAQAAGAKAIQFSQPVPFYVENFLGFPVGMSVPNGYYDSGRGEWVPEDRGRIIKILSITGGMANLDVNGDGAPDVGSALTDLGIDNAERTRLAQLYVSGQSLWRVPMTHFSLRDLNWPFGFPLDAILRGLGKLWNQLTNCGTTQGSVIECDNQVLGERLAIAGTPYTLNYRSGRVAGSGGSRTLRIPLTGSTLPASLKRIDLEVYVAGQKITRSFQPQPNLITSLTWDGKDAYGRPVQGLQLVRVRVGDVYDAVYMEPAALRQDFAQWSTTSPTQVPARREITSWLEQPTTLGSWDAQGVGLGGSMLSVHHAYDPNGQTLYLGDGRRMAAENLNTVITTIAGTGVGGFSGDGGPATAAKLNGPVAVAARPDKTVYIVDHYNERIRKIDPNGVISTYAGTGAIGFNGDNQPATAASIYQPNGMELMADGSLIFTDQGNYRIRKIDPSGIITTLVGSNSAYTGDGGPATEANVSRFPRDIAIDPTGGFYLVDGVFHVVRRVTGSGIIWTVAGDGIQDSVAIGDNGPALSARFNLPEDLALGPDGSLYIEDGDNARVRRIGTDGIIRTVVGTGVSGFSGDGGLASQARISRDAIGLAIAPDGTIYLADLGNCRVRRITVDGIITTFAGTGICTTSGDGGPANRAGLKFPYGVAVGPAGEVYITELDGNRVRKVTPPLPGYTTTDLAVASEDGRELYQFDQYGRHLRTNDALTGAVILTFGYDGAGRLTTITDADDNVTTIEHDAQGRPTAIVAPFGQRTVLTTDGAGYLATVANPAGQTVRLYHGPTGLLDSLADPRAKIHRFGYDSVGRLVRDDDPAGGFKTLSLTEGDTTRTVQVPSALGRTWTYRTDLTSVGGIRRVETDAAGLTRTSTAGPDGNTTINLPEGVTVTLTEAPDPRWGLQAPLLQGVTLNTPGGLTATLNSRRRVTLTSPSDPLSLASQIDSLAFNGRWTVRTYTQATRALVQTSPAGRQLFGRVDAQGRLIKAQVNGLDSVALAYDSRGRLSQEQVGGRIWTYSYDTRGRLLSTLDPMGRRDSLFYDDADRLARRVLPGGREVVFAYDSSGNLVSVTPPQRPAHRFSYTAADQASNYTPPAAGLPTPGTSYSYNQDHQLTQLTRPDGLTVGFDYEPTSGRPSAVTFDRGQLGYSYHPTTGLLSNISAPGQLSLDYTYDGSLRTAVSWGGAVSGSVGVTYNNDFRITAQTVNGENSLGFSYDGDGLLKAAGALGIKRHSLHGLVERDSIGNLRTVTGYDPKGALASLVATYSGTTRIQTSYIRDSLSRIMSLTETVAGGSPTTIAYTYDPAGRLFEVRRNGLLTATYEYDPNGNRNQLTTPGGVVSGSYDDQDRLTSYGTTSYTYSDNGELRTKVESGVGTTSYTYDVLGNLTAVTLPDGTAITYLIDGQNRRIGKKVNGTLVKGFLYQSQLAPVAELDGNNQVVSRFVYGTKTNVPDYLIKGAVTYRLITDHLGSVRLVVNTATGVIAQRVDYDEFGRITQNTAPGFQPFGFAGGLLDDQTALVRFGSRDYDPTVGRWTAKDPIGFQGGSANLYTYADSDPLNYIDPDGLSAGGKIIQIFVRGFKALERNVPWERLVEAGKEGEDLLVHGEKNASQLAREIGDGKTPISHPRHGPAHEGYRPHYHPHGHPGVHIFYSIAPLLTLSHYAQGQSCLLQGLAQLGDFFNPLSTPNDLLELWDLVSGP